MSVSFFVILGIIIWVVGALLPAILAKRKGYSFIIFILISWLISWVLAMIVALVLRDKTLTPEQIAASKAADAALAKEENAKA